MRNDITQTITAKIIESIKDSPYFSIENLKFISEVSSGYLKIILYRLLKKGYIIRLKKGIYVSKNFINDVKNKNLLSPYLEFMAGKIYQPSYLSLDYILSENEILTEMPKNFTLISAKKTNILTNRFGKFIYHKIKKTFLPALK